MEKILVESVAQDKDFIEVCKTNHHKGYKLLCLLDEERFCKLMDEINNENAKLAKDIATWLNLVEIRGPKKNMLEKFTPKLEYKQMELDTASLDQTFIEPGSETASTALKQSHLLEEG